jgi:hypothetical protein
MKSLKIQAGRSFGEAQVAVQQIRRERDGELIARRKYFCMRLASGCLRPGGDWSEDARNWRLRQTIGRRRAEETKPDRYTPQKPGPEARLLCWRRGRGNWIAVRFRRRNAGVERRAFRRFGRGAIEFGECRSVPKRPIGFVTACKLSVSADTASPA